MTHQQSGFAVVAATLLLPLMILSLSVIWGLRALLQSGEASIHICRLGLWQTQEKQIEELENLIQLNPQVETLREQALNLESEIELALGSGQPAAAVALQARLIVVQKRQQALSFKQQGILQSAKHELAQNLAQIHADLNSNAEAFARATRQWLQYSLRQFPVAEPGLSVREIPHFDSGPSEWEISPSSTRILKLQWELAWNFKIFRPDDETKDSNKEIRWNPPKIKIQQSCAVTLVAGKDHWEPALTAAKSSWN